MSRLILCKADLATHTARMSADPMHESRMRSKYGPLRWRAFLDGEACFEQATPRSTEGTTRRRVIDNKCAACNHRSQRERQARKFGR